MKLGIDALTFTLPAKPLDDNLHKMTSLVADLTQIKERAGTDNQVFKVAYSQVVNAVQLSKPLEEMLTSPIQVRALAMALQSQLKYQINITASILDKINLIIYKPGSLLIETLYQHFLLAFDQLNEPKALAKWLINARPKRNMAKWFDSQILDINGPQWLAKRAVEQQLDFDYQLDELELKNYASGRFLTKAKNIYYVEQLNHIEVNADDNLLIEVQKTTVFESSYDESYLLGHKILNVLISRAPAGNISDAWLNVMMTIAGDPRVAPNHLRYIKWWSHIDAALIAKMQGWLSKLDLKLFLEALENFSHTSGDPELLRMFPSRKRFLEGMFNAGVITNTRLYLSRAAAKYLQLHYKTTHLPNYSVVADGNKSIIYVRMGDRHMIEGSHSCFMWLYDDLHPSATVFNYNDARPDYQQLTSGLSHKMLKYGIVPVDNIQHNPTNFSWQKTALTKLKSMGVALTAQNVLTAEDYALFKRTHGAGQWH